MKKRNFVLLSAALLLTALMFVPKETEARVRYGKLASIVQEDGTSERECLSSIFKRECRRPATPE